MLSRKEVLEYLQSRHIRMTFRLELEEFTDRKVLNLKHFFGTETYLKVIDVNFAITSAPNTGKASVEGSSKVYYPPMQILTNLYSEFDKNFRVPLRRRSPACFAPSQTMDGRFPTPWGSIPVSEYLNGGKVSSLFTKEIFYEVHSSIVRDAQRDSQGIPYDETDFAITVAIKPRVLLDILMHHYEGLNIPKRRMGDSYYLPLEGAHDYLEASLISAPSLSGNHSKLLWNVIQGKETTRINANLRLSGHQEPIYGLPKEEAPFVKFMSEADIASYSGRVITMLSSLCVSQSDKALYWHEEEGTGAPHFKPHLDGEPTVTVYKPKHTSFNPIT